MKVVQGGKSFRVISVTQPFLRADPAHDWHAFLFLVAAFIAENVVKASSSTPPPQNLLLVYSFIPKLNSKLTQKYLGSACRMQPQVFPDSLISHAQDCAFLVTPGLGLPAVGFFQPAVSSCSSPRPPLEARSRAAGASLPHRGGRLWEPQRDMQIRGRGRPSRGGRPAGGGAVCR